MIFEFISQHLSDRLFAYQLAATLTTYSVITTCIFIRKRQKRFKLFELYGIPGPKPRLLDGNLHYYLPVQACYKVDQALMEKYGKYYGLFIGDEPSLVISDLDLIKKVFLEKSASFKERMTVFLDTPLSHGILFAPYNRWKAMRKIMSTAFSSYTMRGNSSTEFIEESIKLMLDYINDKLTTAAGKSADIDMHELMKATALHMISSMAIKLPNVAVREHESHVKSLDAFLSSCDKGIVITAIRFPILKRLLSFLATHFEHDATMKLIHQGLYARIDKSLSSLQSQTGKSNGNQNSSNNNNNNQPAETPQLIDTIIRMHHEGRLTRNEVIGNAEAILFAGYDTTSTTLSYIFWTLGKHPEIQERLRNELMAHGIESKYLEQVINEVMRLYPTVISFTTRLATETAMIDEQLTVPQGTRVVFNSWLVHRNPQIWPQPEKFDPERFREGAEIHPCAFAPFGFGERKCLGYSLAKLEMKMITCDILMRYRIRTKAPEELELITYATVLTKPQDKIMVELERI